MKYANITGQVYLKADSQESLNPERAISVRKGQEFEDDAELVIHRPELFTDLPPENEE